MPIAEWSTAEWASVLSTAFAAVAAGASWAVIWTERRRQREAQTPHVTAGFLVWPAFPGSSEQVGTLVFANGGPGLAIGLAYVGVHRDPEFKYQGYVGNGFLHPGAESKARLKRLIHNADGSGDFVWFCRDVHNNVHVWGYDGSSRRIAASDYLAHRAPRTSDDYFRLVYPDIPFP